LVGEGVCVCDGRDVRAIGEVEGLCHEPMRGETRRLWVARGTDWRNRVRGLRLIEDDLYATVRGGDWRSITVTDV